MNCLKNRTKEEAPDAANGGGSVSRRMLTPHPLESGPGPRRQHAGMGKILPFKSARMAIRAGNRDFLLDTSLVKDGTGIARFLEVLPDGRAVLLGCSYCNAPALGWIFGQFFYAVPMPTPEEAAQEFLKKALHLKL